jgi:hypothetical protein
MGQEEFLKAPQGKTLCEIFMKTTTDTTDFKAPEGIYNRIMIAEAMNGFAEAGKTVWVMFYVGNSACHGLIRGYAGHADGLSYRVRGGDFSEIQFKVSDIHCIHNNTITLR